MTEPDYIVELEELRSIYVRSTPRQRLRIISQRIANPAHGPNILVTYVSAVEALARSLAMHVGASSKDQVQQRYSKCRNREVKSLIVQYLHSKGQLSPSDFFGAESWRKFGYAVRYRNLLVHECTYLGQDRYPHLIDACQVVLDKLAEFAGIKRRGPNHSSRRRSRRFAPRPVRLNSIVGRRC